MSMRAWAVSAVSKIGEACGGDKQIALLLTRLGRAVGALDDECAQQRRTCNALRDRVGQQYRLLREASATGLLPADLAIQINAAAPAGVVPLTKRNELWAVQTREPDELFPMLDKQAAALFASVANDVRSMSGMPANAKVVPSPWDETAHWKALAEYEGQWVSDAQSLLAEALRRNEELEEQLTRARAGESLPVRSLRHGRIFEDQAGARYVLLGDAEWECRPVSVYRCGKTGNIHIQAQAEFSACMKAVRE